MHTGQDRETFGRARLSFADEAEYDSSRTSKALYMTSGRSARKRGSASQGAQLRLRWANGHEGVGVSTVVLDRWEITRIRRVLPTELHEALRAAPDAVQPEVVATAIAGCLGTSHSLHEFFMAASLHGGFTVERA